MITVIYVQFRYNFISSFVAHSARQRSAPVCRCPKASSAIKPERKLRQARRSPGAEHGRDRHARPNKHTAEPIIIDLTRTATIISSGRQSYTAVLSLLLHASVRFFVDIKLYRACMVYTNK